VKLLTFTRKEPGRESRIGAWLDGDIIDLQAAQRRASRSTCDRLALQ